MAWGRPSSIRSHWGLTTGHKAESRSREPPVQGTACLVGHLLPRVPSAQGGFPSFPDPPSAANRAILLLVGRFQNLFLLR